MSRDFCSITGVPAGTTEPALLAEWPTVSWSGEVDRSIGELAEGAGPWVLDTSRPNLYLAVWTWGERWGVSPTRPLSAAMVRWLRWAVDSLTATARAGLGIKRLYDQPSRGVFMLEVDWYEPRWKPVPREEVRRWSEPFLALLNQLRMSGVCHGGIAPSVLFVDPDRAEVRLHGFSFAQVVSGVRRQLAPGLGELVGNPLYVAPEVVAGEPPGVVSDIYSLGASLLTIAGMVRGHSWRAPFVGVDGMSKRTSLVLEDWVLEGMTPDPALVGMLEPDPRIRAHMLPSSDRRGQQSPTVSATIDDEFMDEYLLLALERLGLEVPEGMSPMELLEELANARRAARPGAPV